MKFSPRMDGIEISMIRQIMSQAQGCVNLGLGEPGFPFPEVVLDEAHQILDEGRIGYTPNAGLPELCRQIHGYHGARESHKVCVTSGSQEALFDVLFTLVGPGDEVLVPNPGYVSYPTVTRLAGGVPIFYPLKGGDDFSFSPAALEKRISPRTRVIILSTPSNPTGRCLTLKQLEEVSRIARKRDLVLVSDEIYREIHYTKMPPHSITEASEDAVVLSGVSKMASMTGWRLGWVLGPAEVVDRVTVMHQCSSICASTLSQRAALKLFTPKGRQEVELQRSRHSDNFRFVTEWLDQHLEQPYVRPEGAFYLMLSVHSVDLESLDVSLELLKDGVATIPGSAFGSEGEGYLRVSFAGELSSVEDGLSRLKKGLGRLMLRNTVAVGARPDHPGRTS